MSSLLEPILLPLVEQICLGAAQVHNLGTSISLGGGEGEKGENHRYNKWKALLQNFLWLDCPYLQSQYTVVLALFPGPRPAFHLLQFLFTCGRAWEQGYCCTMKQFCIMLWSKNVRLSHRWYTPCSSKHQRLPDPHKWCTCPGRTRSYTRHISVPAYTASHRSHRSHRDHHLDVHAREK